MKCVKFRGSFEKNQWKELRVRSELEGVHPRKRCTLKGWFDDVIIENGPGEGIEYLRKRCGVSFPYARQESLPEARDRSLKPGIAP